MCFHNSVCRYAITGLDLLRVAIAVIKYTSCLFVRKQKEVDWITGFSSSQKQKVRANFAL